MPPFSLNDCRVGDALPSLTLPPMTRHILALYCGGSADHVAIHTDSDFARAAGLPDVIGHGMLTMAYVGRMLTNIVPPQDIKSWNLMFLSPSRIGDCITCHGQILERREDDRRTELRIALGANTEDGRELAKGEALISLLSSSGEASTIIAAEEG